MAYSIATRRNKSNASKNPKTAAFASVMAEDVDVFTGFPAPENIPQFEADPRFQVLIGSTEGETILSINNKREPFDNV